MKLNPGCEWNVLYPWCDRLNLIGKADLVEFHPDGSVYPVEFKHGAKRQKLHDDIQLAAQAMCLEDMLGRPVPKGAIFHASSHRRCEVTITSELRRLVVETAEAIRAMLASGKLPPPVYDALQGMFFEGYLPARGAGGMCAAEVFARGAV